MGQAIQLRIVLCFFTKDAATELDALRKRVAAHSAPCPKTLSVKFDFSSYKKTNLDRANGISELISAGSYNLLNHPTCASPRFLNPGPFSLLAASTGNCYLEPTPALFRISAGWLPAESFGFYPLTVTGDVGIGLSLLRWGSTETFQVRCPNSPFALQPQIRPLAMAPPGSRWRPFSLLHGTLFCSPLAVLKLPGTSLIKVVRTTDGPPYQPWASAFAKAPIRQCNFFFRLPCVTHLWTSKKTQADGTRWKQGNRAQMSPPRAQGPGMPRPLG